MIANFFNRTLYNKLLLAFIVVGFLPFFIFYLYVIYWGEETITQRLIDEQSIQLQKIVDNVNNHILSLEKELKFISQLDVMDDLISDDIDKRIARLLIQKKEDIALDVSLFVLDNKGTFISSSDKSLLEQHFMYMGKLRNTDKYFVRKNELYICSKIFASFDKAKRLGYLVMQYNLENLNRYLVHREGIHTSIWSKKNAIIIGDKENFSLDLTKDFSSEILQEHLLNYKKLSPPLQEWYVIYAVDKTIALGFLYNLLYVILYIIPIALIIIIVIGIISSKNIIKPLLELTSSAESITKTKDYTTKVMIDSEDEIGRLSYAFNELLGTTNKALVALEEENKLRLKRFIELTEIFNTIIQTKDEDECINTSIQEMQKLTHGQKLNFTKNSLETQNAIALLVDDFENDEKVYFGSIEIDADKMGDTNEEKFYRSIVSMIVLQLERIRLVEKTMQASRAKSAFISNMSHELRTPLNAIIGFTQYILVYEELNEEQNEMIGNIENSAQYLLEMINGILDIAKIEAGKMEAHFDRMDIVSLLQDIYAMLEPLAEQKSLTFQLDTGDMEELSISSDAKLVKQIVINMVSNAIKFTQTGGINISFVQKEQTIEIRIKDTGIGIAKEDLEKLFKDFTQVENVMQKKHKGTGLGLSLSKKLANLLHGDLVLKSEGLGRGSEIVVTLPCIQ